MLNNNKISINDDGEFTPVNKKISNQVEENVNLKMLDGIHTGQVKWFNRRRGYGFITIIESKNDEKNEQSFIGKDVFVHQSHIKPKKSSYRSLEENEYVEFQLSLDNKNVTQAINITGLKNGTLLCDSLKNNNQNEDNNNQNFYSNRHFYNKREFNKYQDNNYQNTNSFENLRK